jgi:hypothetical protein
MGIELISSLGLAYFMGFLNLYLLKVSLQSLSFVLIASKAFSNLDIEKDL